MGRSAASLGFWVGIVAAATVAGCGSVEKQFLDALNASSEKKVCVQPSELGVTVYSSRDGKAYLAAEDPPFGGPPPVKALDALRARGYAQKEPYMMQVNYAPLPGYEITEKGRPIFPRNGPVCIGERHATEIIDYTESQGGGPVQGSQVNFKYEVEFNDLIKDLGLAEELSKHLTLLRNTEGKGQAMFVKTNKGWRLESAMW